mmetsp:Transcript_57651/g.158799  ORF Transcript_57651/g.158799 Transcript_57651/m.158799 type:complete len:307 (+) Transcript_57651:994-1914(+)
MHQSIPVLSGGAPKQNEQRPRKRAEVRVLVEITLVLDLSEELHAHDRKDEEQEAQQGRNIAQAGQSQDERVEEAVQPLGTLDEPQNAPDAERSYNGGDPAGTTAGGPHEDVAHTCAEDDKEVEHVPVVTKVVPLHGGDLHDCLHGEHRRENVVHVVQRCLIVLRHTEVSGCHDARVDDDAAHDCPLKVFRQDNLETPLPELRRRWIELFLRLELRRSLLCFHPRLLGLRQQTLVALRLLSHRVEVVDDDTHEEVHDKVRPDHHEEYKKDSPPQVVVADRLHVDAGGGHRRKHDVHPSLRRADLYQR